jgi:hypothetical protein
MLGRGMPRVPNTDGRMANARASRRRARGGAARPPRTRRRRSIRRQRLLDRSRATPDPGPLARPRASGGGFLRSRERPPREVLRAQRDLTSFEAEDEMRLANRRAAVAWNRVGSPYGRDTSMAPSSALTIIRAASLGDPANSRVPSSWPWTRTASSHVSFSSKNHRVLHRLGERSVLRGKHAAQAHPLALEDVRVELRVGIELGRRVDRTGPDLCQGALETIRVSLDERLPELRLAREVIVQTRLGDLELGRDVRVAEAVESADLYEAFGGIQDPGRRVLASPLPRARHPRILSELDFLPTSRFDI